MKPYAQRHSFLSMLCFILMLSLVTFNTYALTEGDYTYTVTNGMATINEFNKSFSGTLVISATLGGYPVETLGNGSFSDCDGLIAVTIQQGLFSIGDWAFTGCDSLTNITIASTVTNIGDGAFSGCQRLPTIIFPSHVTRVSNHIFEGCNNLTSIIVPSNVTSIGEYSFSYCNALTNIAIQEGVENIGNYAFYGCGGLTTVDIPSTVARIGAFSFYDCDSITNLHIKGTGSSIGEYAFYDCNMLTGLTIDEGILSIGSFAFYGCNSLANLCTPFSLTEIGDLAFYDCVGLTSAKIQGNMARIGSAAFSGCSSLANLTISEGVTSIGRSSFESCVNLSRVMISSNVTTIGDCAFNCCYKLTKVGFQNGVANIGERAFCSCTSLASISMPSSVTSIGASAFAGCENLTTVCFWGNAPLITYPLFDGAPATTYYLPGREGWVDPWSERPTVCDTRFFVPIINEQPTDQNAVVGSPVNFSVLATSEQPITYQWFHNGQSIAGAISAVLAIDDVSASDLGMYSVRVANLYGAETGASAKLTLLGGEQYNQVITRIPDPVQPEKGPGQDSLIVITHGYQPDGADANVDWVLEMAADISVYLTKEGKTNWRIEPYCWQERAGPTPETALLRGDELGAVLGLQIGVQHWQHVHLIAHSAGAALIQAAIERIKLLSPETIVHATFLDPFAGYTTVNRLVYGHHANWSDNYFTRDRTTKYTTNSKLIYSHNVDVTPLDPDYSGGSLLCFYSDSIMPVSTPVITSGALQDSEHSWPHDFYASTITNGVPDSEGYGFPLSKEAGNWQNLDGYERGNNPTILGSSTLACLPDTELDMTIGAPIDFPSLFHASSAAGVTVLPSGLYLTSTSSTPLLLARDLLDINPPAVTANTVWFSAAVNVTGTVNFVSCDIAFTSPDAAQGLLTVFWETNAIGSVDERTVMAEGENYRFPLPENYSSGTYALGFRLDSFTNITSNVTVTNVAAGFAGNTAPMSLDISNMIDGVFMTLSGPSLHNYLVEASTNLVDWAPFAILANTNGAVRFNDPDAASYSKRFYRAVMP